MDYKEREGLERPGEWRYALRQRPGDESASVMAVLACHNCGAPQGVEVAAGGDVQLECYECKIRAAVRLEGWSTSSTAAAKLLEVAAGDAADARRRGMFKHLILPKLEEARRAANEAGLSGKEEHVVCPTCKGGGAVVAPPGATGGGRA